MPDIYQAKAGDRYLSRIEDGVEYLVELGVLPLNPLWRWDSNPPYGVLTVLVTGVGAEGVQEEAEALGAGDAVQLGVGWAYATSRGHGCDLKVQVFRRTRTHPVVVMPVAEAEALLARLRAAQVERRRIWAAREAPQLEAWERHCEEYWEAESLKQTMRRVQL